MSLIEIDAERAVEFRFGSRASFATVASRDEHHSIGAPDHRCLKSKAQQETERKVKLAAKSRTAADSHGMHPYGMRREVGVSCRDIVLGTSSSCNSVVNFRTLPFAYKPDAPAKEHHANPRAPSLARQACIPSRKQLKPVARWDFPRKSPGEPQLARSPRAYTLAFPLCKICDGWFVECMHETARSCVLSMFFRPSPPGGSPLRSLSYLAWKVKMWPKFVAQEKNGGTEIVLW